MRTKFKKMLLFLAMMASLIFLFVGCEGEELKRTDLSEKEFVYGSTVSIKSNMESALEFSGELEQTISGLHPEFQEVTITANPGYKYCYYEINGVKYTSNIISLDSLKEDTVINVYADYETYELPIVNINADEAITSKEEYVDMTFDIINCEDELEGIEGGIRLRGNSTRRYDKKPYRIKFDKKQSLFGLDKAKSWVLLAEYIDPSALHNYTAFSLANNMEGLSFTPTPHKVNVYLNGEYIGLYTLCEQVQENEGRIDIEEEITADMTELKDFNFFICVDKSVTEDVGAIEGETYFYLPQYDRYIELKYPEKDQFVSEEQFEKFFAELKQYVEYLYGIFTENNAEAIKEEINLNSLIDYLIVDQIMGERDHAYKSFNMYFTHTSDNEEENNKLNFGPIWDYDWSLHTEWTDKPNEDYRISTKIHYSNIFFEAMVNVPEFYEIIKDRYTNNVSALLNEYINSIDAIVEGMKVSLTMNEKLWYSDFTEGITDNNIKFLKDYLAARKELLDNLWIE